MNTSDLYEQDIKQYVCAEQFISAEDPSAEVVNEGTILPAKADKSLPWGRGVLDNKGIFVELSRLDNSFGGECDFEEQNIVVCNEDVLFLGIFPDHWGHFLINVLCKLWCIDELPTDTKIAYVGLDWAETKCLSETYINALALAGIPEKRLLYIDKQTRFNNIFLPERTMGFERSWHPK